MKQGDIVRLKRPFTPIVGSTQAFLFGQVIDVITESSEETANLEIVESEIIELLIYLYNPETGTFYQDEWGEIATFSIYPDELEKQ